MRVDRHRLLVGIAYAIGFALGLYVVTRPRVIRVVRERIPSHKEVSAVLRRAEQITKQAAPSAGKDTA